MVSYQRACPAECRGPPVPSLAASPAGRRRSRKPRDRYADACACLWSRVSGHVSLVTCLGSWGAFVKRRRRRDPGEPDAGAAARRVDQTRAGSHASHARPRPAASPTARPAAGPGQSASQGPSKTVAAWRSSSCAKREPASARAAQPQSAASNTRASASRAGCI